jgi:hypothetical protein
MIRRITAVGVAAIAAAGLAGVAVAASGHAAKTFKASLAPVNSAATTARVPDVRGRAQLVDGKKNNKVSLHMRGLAANTTYLWHVHEGSCPVAGPPIAGWTYRTQSGANGTLTTNAAGNANTKGKSATFNALPAMSVNVHVAAPTNGLAAGTIIACGDLKASKASGKSKAKPKKAHPAHPPQANGPKP